MKLKTDWLESRDLQYSFNLEPVGRCENENDPDYNCSCDYNRCYVISSIKSEGFSSEDYVKVARYCLPESEEHNQELLDKIVAVFKEYDFEDTSLFDYNTDRGYYGEYLSTVSLSVASEIIEKLNNLNI